MMKELKIMYGEKPRTMEEMIAFVLVIFAYAFFIEKPVNIGIGAKLTYTLKSALLTNSLNPILDISEYIARNGISSKHSSLLLFRGRSSIFHMSLDSGMGRKLCANQA